MNFETTKTLEQFNGAVETINEMTLTGHVGMTVDVHTGGPSPLHKTPSEDQIEGSLGYEYDVIDFAAVMKDGRVLKGCPRDYERDSNYAYLEREHRDGLNFGHWLAQQGISPSDLDYIIEIEGHERHWEGQESEQSWHCRIHTQLKFDVDQVKEDLINAIRCQGGHRGYSVADLCAAASCLGVKIF